MGRRRSGVRPASNSSIEIDFYYRGARCRERIKKPPTPRNLAWAEKLKARIELEIAKNAFIYEDYFPDSNKLHLFAKYKGGAITVEQALQDYLKGAKAHLQTTTMNNYRTAAENYLIPEFGKLALTEVTRARIKAWIGSLSVSKKRIQNLLLPLRAVMSDALADGLIQNNPLYGWKIRVVASPKEHDDIDPLNLDEIDAVVEAASPQVANLIKFGCWSGLRLSEMFALMWKDVDLENRVIHVRRAMVAREIKEPKTASGRRDVKMLSPAYEALSAQRKHTRLPKGYIFHNPNTDAAWGSDCAFRLRHWMRALNKAGVRYRYPYQMRHTYASIMISAGEDSRWVATQMGHSNLEMVSRCYARWMDTLAVDAGSKAERLLEK